MNCPNCKIRSLEPADLDFELRCFACAQCGGQWLKWADYWKWHEAHAQDPPPRASTSPAGVLPQAQGTKPKLCLDCGHLLARRKVGHGLSFALAHCGSCGSTWFDRGEWESLRRRNFHTRMHLVFTDEWQAEVKHELQRESREQLLAQKFGPEDLAELKRIKAWLAAHPKSKEAWAYLLDSDEED